LPEEEVGGALPTPALEKVEVVELVVLVLVLI
jgi:hypothetical protein